MLDWLSIRQLMNKSVMVTLVLLNFIVPVCMCLLSYTIPTDGTATEDVTFVGNNKKWITDDGDSQLLLMSGGNMDAGFGSILVVMNQIRQIIMYFVVKM